MTTYKVTDTVTGETYPAATMADVELAVDYILGPTSVGSTTEAAFDLLIDALPRLVDGASYHSPILWIVVEAQGD